jgi:hypothetical protein
MEQLLMANNLQDAITRAAGDERAAIAAQYKSSGPITGPIDAVAAATREGRSNG